MEKVRARTRCLNEGDPSRSPDALEGPSGHLDFHDIHRLWVLTWQTCSNQCFTKVFLAS